MRHGCLSFRSELAILFLSTSCLPRPADHTNQYLLPLLTSYGTPPHTMPMCPISISHAFIHILPSFLLPVRRSVTEVVSYRMGEIVFHHILSFGNRCLIPRPRYHHLPVCFKVTRGFAKRARRILVAMSLCRIYRKRISERGRRNSIGRVSCDRGSVAESFIAYGVRRAKIIRLTKDWHARTNFGHRASASDRSELRLKRARSLSGDQTSA